MKNKKISVIILIALFFTLFIFSYGISFAKYASASLWNYYLATKEFYFESDYLNVDTKTNVNKLWDGESIHFNLKNSSNKSLVTDYDISYKVTCSVKNPTPGVSCVINGTDSNTYTGTLSSYEMCVNNTDDNVDTTAYTKSECENNSYTWIKKVAEKDLYFDVLGVKKEESVEVEIVAESTSPYKKTIKGAFNLKRDPNVVGGIETKYNNYDGYDELIISNSGESNKCLRVQWDDPELKVDYDATKINAYTKNTDGFINSIDITVNKKDSLSYKFYKTNTKQYTIADFSLLEINC